MLYSNETKLYTNGTNVMLSERKYRRMYTAEFHLCNIQKQYIVRYKHIKTMKKGKGMIHSKCKLIILQYLGEKC